ncbi:hypothetical protein EDD71_10923 [Fonticella tunisiensis]|uniref:DUF6385 domain-containing protein n=1 Tax=Fonticella tunisiensis TaxID=1096341 RepID=A0A4R7KPF7_9CLOT|nr:hypothetical protein EDD71_10923 [Fonticella tunisiensis]
MITVKFNNPIDEIAVAATINVEFQEQTFVLPIPGTATTPSIDASKLVKGTFFVKNTGAIPITATLEVSGDGISWVPDTVKNVPAGNVEVLVPIMYGKYYHVVCTAGGVGNATIIFSYQIYS